MVTIEDDIKECLTVLRTGGVILYPTDTIWGLGCDATNEKAVGKIYSIKQRADEKAMIALVADQRDVLQYVAGADLSLFDYLETRVKPTTVIYPGAIGLADNLVGNDGSIAIRICRNDFCRHLIKRFGKPIVSTSANISGEPSPAYFDMISNAINEKVDYTVHHRRDDRQPASPSSIIRWKGEGEVEVIRE